MTDCIQPDANGYYPDDITDILASANPEKKAILTRVARIVIEGDRFVQAMEWLEEVLLESGTGHEATMGLLYGAPGVGKSTVLRRFTKKYGGALETRSGTKRVVIRVVTPSNPNLGTILDAILDALGAEAVKGGKNPDKKAAVVAQLARQGVKVAVFDEFTHIIEDKSEKFAKNVARELKEMLSEGRCQCVFAGTPEIQGIHTLYNQFRRRSGGDLFMPAFNPADDDDVEEWIEALDVINDVLPIEPARRLSDTKRAMELLTASEGIMDHIMKLLFRATALAYDEGSKKLTDQHLADAFERLRRGDGKSANPFGKPSRRRVRPTASQADEADLEDGWTNLRSLKPPKNKENDQ